MLQTRRVNWRVNWDNYKLSAAGVFGTLLLIAFLYLAPLLGVPYFDVGREFGLIFVGDWNAAFWIGFLIILFMGIIVLPRLYPILFPILAVPRAWRGLAFGLALWLVSQGLILPLVGLILNTVGRGQAGVPGFFNIGSEAGPTIAILFAHLAYGAGVGLVYGFPDREN